MRRALAARPGDQVAGRIARTAVAAVSGASSKSVPGAAPLRRSKRLAELERQQETGAAETSAAGARTMQKRGKSGAHSKRTCTAAVASGTKGRKAKGGGAVKKCTRPAPKAGGVAKAAEAAS